MPELRTNCAPRAATATERSAADPVALLRDMLRLRAYDERAVSLQRQGRIGAYPMFWGEEAVQAGGLNGLRPDDWIFPSYRQNGLAILRGLPPEQALAYFNGDPHARFDPRAYGCAPQCVPVATQIPHAVGWAWGQARTDTEAVALAFFGDGATSEGDFHEGLNIAGVVKAPVIFLCTNNRWAISTPFERQTAARTIADKASGFGILGIEVDGFDACAVRDVVAAAAARARDGEGPTLIEAHSYRLGPHATADDPDRYRDPAEAEAWRQREPVRRLAGGLVSAGLMTEEEVARCRREAFEEMAAAAERVGPPGSLERRLLVDHVLSDRPPLLKAQLAGRTA